MVTKNSNWLVRCYRGEKISRIIVIKDRTEREARREAENNPDVLNAEDWTLTKT
jgi:hypothetical protein